MKKTIARAVMAGAALVLAGTAVAAPASAAEEIPEPPEVSWNGESGTWSQSLDAPMFNVTGMVPCDSETASALVRNGGTHLAHLTVTFKNARIPADKQAYLDMTPEEAAGNPTALAVRAFYEELHLQTSVDGSSVDGTLPDLIKEQGDSGIVLFDADVPAGAEATVSSTYAWKYANACSTYDEAGNGIAGPWMDFDVVAVMYYVVDSTAPTETPTETTSTPTTTVAPTSTSPAASSTLIPPTSTSPAASSAVQGQPGSNTPNNNGGAPVANNQGPSNPLASTGLTGPALGLSLAALVLIALGAPLATRLRKRRH